MLDKADILELVEKRLSSFGVKPVSNDRFIISFIIDKQIEFIKSYCNISKISLKLKEVLTDLVCGDFLFNKKSTGMLDLDNISIDEALVQNIKEGDTSITFVTATTNEEKVDSLIKYLKTASKNYLVSCRRIKW